MNYIKVGFTLFILFCFSSCGNQDNSTAKIETQDCEAAHDSIKYIRNNFVCGFQEQQRILLGFDTVLTQLFIAFRFLKENILIIDFFSIALQKNGAIAISNYECFFEVNDLSVKYDSKSEKRLVGQSAIFLSNQLDEFKLSAFPFDYLYEQPNYKSFDSYYLFFEKVTKDSYKYATLTEFKRLTDEYEHINLLRRFIEYLDTNYGFYLIPSTVDNEDEVSE